MLNDDQFDSVRAGDWYCDACPSNGRSHTKYRYFWNREIAAPSVSSSAPPASHATRFGEIEAELLGGSSAEPAPPDFKCPKCKRGLAIVANDAGIYDMWGCCNLLCSERNANKRFATPWLAAEKSSPVPVQEEARWVARLEELEQLYGGKAAHNHAEAMRTGDQTIGELSGRQRDVATDLRQIASALPGLLEARRRVADLMERGRTTSDWTISGDRIYAKCGYCGGDNGRDHSGRVFPWPCAHCGKEIFLADPSDDRLREKIAALPTVPISEGNGESLIGGDDAEPFVSLREVLEIVKPAS